MDIYGHVAPGMQATVAARFDSILKPEANRLDRELENIIQN